MKIALINNLYQPFNRGGAETVVELMAKGLDRAGHQVFIITTKPYLKKFSIFPAVAPQMRGQGGGNFQFSIYHINSLYYYLHRTPKFLRIFWHLWDMFNVINYFKVKTILLRERPDVVITHNLKGVGYLIPLAIKQLKIKHGHYLHDIQLIHPSGLMIYGQEERINEWPAKIYQNLCHWLFNSPAIVISPTNWLLKMHTDKNFFTESNKVVLSSSASSQTLSLLLPRTKLRGKRGDGEVFRFLYLGQIVSHKGIIFLITAFAKLQQQVNQQKIELLIAGRGSRVKEVKQLAEKNNQIKFLGWQNREQVNKLLLSVDCLVVPSLCYENSPTVINLAWTAGLPVLAAKIGGITELAEDGSGILFEPGNIGDLVNKMSWALTNENELLKIGQIGKEKAERFNSSDFVNKLIELIK